MLTLCLQSQSESVARKYMNINNLSKFVVLNPAPRTCFIHWSSISYPPRARCDTQQQAGVKKRQVQQLAILLQIDFVTDNLCDR